MEKFQNLTLKIEPGTHEGRPITRLDLLLNDDGQYLVVANGYGDLSEHFLPSDKVEAYFNLFAAAPLMLSALIQAVEQEDKNAHQFFLQLPPYTPGEYGFPDWYHDAKDAIAKTTNTSQP